MLTLSFLTSFKNKKTDNNEGFTLIEILVVISIIIILSTALLGYSQTIGKHLETVSTVGTIEALVSRAKALGVQTFFDKWATPGVCAYGIAVDQNAQKIFIYQDVFAGGCPSPSSGPNWEEQYGYDPLSDIVLTGETNELSLANSSISFDIVGGSVNLSDVTFIPPSPVTVINSDNDLESAIIHIADPERSFAATITVTDDGQISYSFE